MSSAGLRGTYMTASANPSALDDWASIRRSKRKDAAGAASLSQAARVADPDPWRTDLRNALDQADKAAQRTVLQALAKEAKYDELGPISLHMLGAGLDNAGDRPLGESVLRKAQQRHPQDVWINYELGKLLEGLSRRDEAIRFYTAARAIRPETAHELAHALEKKGESDESVAVFRDLDRLRPKNSRHLGCLGRELKARGRSQEAATVLEAAVATAREAIRASPDNAYAHSSLAFSLEAQGKLVSAIAEYRNVLRLIPDSAATHDNLGVTLELQGKLAEAIAEYRTAIRLQPDFALAHINLGLTLDQQGKREEAIAEFQTAIRLQPDFALAHNCLGKALDQQGRRGAAIAEYRTVLRLLPEDAFGHNQLAWALALTTDHPPRDYDEAATLVRKAIALQPKDGNFYNTLALAEYRRGRWDEAIAASEQSIKLSDGVDASNWFFLAMAHARKGEKDEAITWFDKAVGWTKEKAPKNQELLSFWSEAAQLLGRPGPALLKKANTPSGLPEARKVPARKSTPWVFRGWRPVSDPFRAVDGPGMCRRTDIPGLFLTRFSHSSAGQNRPLGYADGVLFLL
jgi:superkiller protein 3